MDKIKYPGYFLVFIENKNQMKVDEERGMWF
jgi:hypothetical protein